MAPAHPHATSVAVYPALFLTAFLSYFASPQPLLPPLLGLLLLLFFSLFLKKDHKGGVADAKEGARAMIAKINEALEPFMDICVKWKFNKLVKAKKKVKEDKFRILVKAEVDNNDNNKKDNNINNNSIRPVFAIFDGWVVKKKGGQFEVQLEEIFRQDIYGPTSKCIINRSDQLRQYCSCI